MTDAVHRLVVGIDYSNTADYALEKTFDLASKEEKAEVHVLNAVTHLGEYVQLDLPDNPAFRLPLSEAQSRLEAHVGAKLASWQEKTGRTFARCVTHVSTEYPAVAIAQLGSDLDATLIVVGTHGRQGLKRLMLGSVAESVARLAHVPVLVVRPKAEQHSVPEIEPPCPRCVETRKETGGAEFWCEQHRARHGKRHTYHFEDRNTKETNFPLVTH